MGLVPGYFTNTDANFDVTFVIEKDGSLTVKPIEVTVKAQNASKVYDNDPTNPKTYEVTITGRVDENDPIAYDISREPGEDVGQYVITPSGDDTQGNYTVKYETGTFTITKDTENMTVTPINYSDVYDGKTHNGGGTATIADATLTYSTDGGTTWTSTVPSITNIGTVKYQVKATHKNYADATATGTLTVTPKPVTVTAKSASKEYGQTDPAFTATVDGVIDNYAIVYTVSRPGAGTDENAGTYPKAIIPTGKATQGNYTVTYVPADFTIEQATGQLTVTATGYKGVYDAKDHAGSATASITEGTTISYSIDGGKTWTAEAPSIKNVGEVEFTVKAENPNYMTATDTATLKVTRAQVTVTAAAANKVYGDDDPTFTATVSGVIDNYKIVYTVSRPGAGKDEAVDVYKDAIIAAGEPTQGNYTVTYVPADFEITKAGTLTVTATGYKDEYDGVSHAGSASANITEGTTISYSTDGGKTWSKDAPSIINVGKQTFTVKAENPNYEDATAKAELEVTPKPVTVTADAASKVYKAADPQFTAQVSGLLGEDTVTYTVSRPGAGEEANELVGSYPKAIVPAGEKEQGNYTVSFVPADFTITGDPIEPKKTTPVVKSNYQAGNKIPFDITVKNVSNVVAENITVKDDTATIIAGTGYTVTDGVATLTVPAGGVVVVKAEHTVTEEDIVAGTYGNTANVTYDGKTIPVTANTEQIEDPNPHMTVTKTSDVKEGTKLKLDDTVTYTIEVKNDGNVTISNIKLTDTVEGYSAQDITKDLDKTQLKPGETAKATYTYTVTEQDILAGKILNTATAGGDGPGGKNPDPTPGTREDPTEEPKPHMTVTKTSDVADGTTASLGQTITYTITVKNDGNVTISNLIVTDTVAGYDGVDITARLDKTTIAPNEEATATFTHVVNTQDILTGSVRNTATADGDTPEKVDDPKVYPGTTDDPTDDIDPTMDVVKTVTSTPDNGTAYVVGEAVDYQITVTNTGNVPYPNLQVVDDLTGDLWIADEANGGTPLAPGQTVTFTTSYTVTENDVTTGTLTNAVAVFGDPIDDPKHPDEPVVPTGDDTVDVPVEQPTIDGGGDTYYTLTVNYIAEGRRVFRSFTGTYLEGSAYNVVSPRLTGFTASRARVRGTITENTTVNVIYTRNTYTVTVNYRDTDGNIVAQTVTQRVPYDNGYNIVSPVVNGYTTTQRAVTGTMPARDVQVTVYYTRAAEETDNTIVIDDYGTPLGLGNVSLNAGDCFE